MWTRKTEVEIERVRRDMRLEFIEGLLTAGFFTATWWHQTNAPTLLIGFGGFLLIFVIAMGLQALTGGNILLTFPAFVPSGSNSSADICVACFTVQNTGPCCAQCGGGLEPLAHWTWKDGAPTQDGAPPQTAETKA